MTSDQQFILALVALMGTTAASLIAAWQTRQTHKAVNGMVSRTVRRARAQGNVEGRAATIPATSPQPGVALKPGVDTLLAPPPDRRD